MKNIIFIVGQFFSLAQPTLAQTLDACRDSADKSGKGGVDGSTIRELNDKLALFFAAKSGQRSFESRDLQHGIFTHYLLEGLRGKAADSDNEVTFQGLASYVSKQVEKNSPVLLEVPATEAQRPNLMGNLSGTIVLGRVERKVSSSPLAEPAKTVTNNLGMRLARIDAGEFMMGNEDSLDDLVKLYPYDQKAMFKDAAKRHSVKITRPFYLGVHEVTVGQFLAFVEATSYESEAKTNGKVSTKQTWNPEGHKAGSIQGNDRPVVNVSWNDAQKFCEWLSREEGRKYRLPTEAEWEYACRAGTRTRYWFGGEPEGLSKVGNVADRTGRAKYSKWKDAIQVADRFADIAPVGSYQPNPWGLHDMHGNVWEWCADWHGDYPNSPVIDPQGPTSGSLRVRRGGGWSDLASRCRSAFRSSGAPGERLDNLGFRVALVAPD